MLINCTVCKTGETRFGRTTVTLERGDTVVVVKDVPAEVCADCGEACIEATVAQRLHTVAEEAVAWRVEVAVLRFAG